MAILNINNFPDRLYRRIKQRAGRNGRSASQEIVQLLEEAVPEAPRRSLLELEGLGKDVWEKALGGKDGAEYVVDERDAWS